ncbi:hypothetical protein ANN_19082 [Periplaneta americana]|uniref:MARVEL domain-containing protein n=1 Tax=Periplaneta americana TaxID=6978 RepID=A0ABQ8SQI1_PERAM|nr:hypothetical protein ANN_19082 [Periplaneta americana]
MFMDVFMVSAVRYHLHGVRISRLASRHPLVLVRGRYQLHRHPHLGIHISAVHQRGAQAAHQLDTDGNNIIWDEWLSLAGWWVSTQRRQKDILHVELKESPLSVQPQDLTCGISAPEISHDVDRVSPWCCVLQELLNTSITTVLYLIAFIVQLSIYSRNYPSYYRDPNLAAGVFGLFNTLAYGAGVYFLYIEWKGTRVSN